MKLKIAFLALAQVFALLFSISASHAARTEKIEMQSRLWEEAKGEATIKDATAGTKEITIRAQNLVPDSVFTVWFVNGTGEQREGVGKGKNSFRTDAAGNGLFSATVSDKQVEGWEKIEVGFHPEGDPKNLENLHVALTGELKEAAG